MARTLVALTIALGVHGLLLVAVLPPIQERPLRPPIPRIVTMTLGYWQPEKPTVEKPEIEAQQPMPSESIPVAPRQVVPTPRGPQRKAPPIKRRMHRPTPEPETPAQPKASDPPRETAYSSAETADAVGSGSEAEVETVMKEAEPLYRMNRPPPYPRMARRRGYEGTVLLEGLVNRSGRVGDLRVFSSSGYPLLDDAAKAAVEKWLFEPGRRGDEAVPTWVRVPIRFVLE